MPKPYYTEDTSALAPPILLEDIGAPYALEERSIPAGAHREPDYLDINPKGRVPALETEGGVITENPAILWYLAETFPDHGLIPDDPFARARVQEVNAYLCATVHVAFAHKQRGIRWSDDPSVIDGMKAKVASNLIECADLIEAHYMRGPWVMGERYSICDPYVFLVQRWLAASDVDVARFPKLARHRDLMLDRPSTKAALSRQGLS